MFLTHTGLSYLTKTKLNYVLPWVFQASYNLTYHLFLGQSFVFLVSFPFDKAQFSELTLTEILNNTKIQAGIEELIGLRSNLCRSAGPPRPGKFHGNLVGVLRVERRQGTSGGERGYVASRVGMMVLHPLTPPFRCPPINTYFSRCSCTWLGLKLGAAWEQGLAGVDRGLLALCMECLRLRLRSRPRCSPVPPKHTLALLRSWRPLGGGSAVSSPSSCRSTI